MIEAIRSRVPQLLLWSAMLSLGLLNAVLFILLLDDVAGVNDTPRTIDIVVIERNQIVDIFDITEQDGTITIILDDPASLAG